MANIKQLSAQKVTWTFANFEKLTGLRLDPNQDYYFFPVIVILCFVVLCHAIFSYLVLIVTSYRSTFKRTCPFYNRVVLTQSRLF